MKKYLISVYLYVDVKNGLTWFFNVDLCDFHRPKILDFAMFHDYKGFFESFIEFEEVTTKHLSKLCGMAVIIFLFCCNLIYSSRHGRFLIKVEYSFTENTTIAFMCI